MQTINITKDQQTSIQNYKKVGIEFDFDDDIVKIYQKKLVNGYILNQKELHERAKEVFPDAKIQPIVFSLDVSSIDEKRAVVMSILSRPIIDNRYTI